MLEEISLEISNYWTSNDFLTESNKNCGTLVAFDWEKYYKDGDSKEKMRVIVLCSDVENIILHDIRRSYNE